MDDCGAVLHNIETKWLYDFSDHGKNAAIFPGRQLVATSRNRHSAAASVHWNRRLALNCLTARVTPLQLSEQGKIFHSQIRHLLQQLESNLAELRGGSDYAQRKIKIAAAHSLSLGLLPSIISQMPPLFTGD